MHFMDSGIYSIHIIRQTKDFEALRHKWLQLVESSSRSTIYQTWEWNDAWWRTFGSGKRLFILEVTHKGNLVGLGPFYISHHLGTPLRRLAFIGTGYADYLDIIAHDDHAQHVANAILRQLQETKTYDMADLQQLAPHAWLRENIPLNPMDSRFQATVRMEPCPYIPLPDSWGTYAASLGKKMRSNIGYYDRLLKRTFPDSDLSIAQQDDLNQEMNNLFDLHQKRWNARLLPGVLSGNKVRGFHRIIADRFQKNGWLRLHVLRINGKTEASLYCFCYRDKYYYYLGGFSPDMSKYSLGTVLTARAIQQAINEECKEFDFLRGNEPYKYRWMPEERYNHRLLLGRKKSLRCRALQRLNRLEAFVEHKAKTFAEKQGRKKEK
jgi:CelD/BcsL family acetyltransferase involved in cellulose biosynthesis